MTEIVPVTQEGGEEPTVAIYARVSTNDQAKHGFSLKAQLQTLRAHCYELGYHVLEEVVDNGVSGSTLVRPGIDRLRELAKDYQVSVILTQDRDRISRNVVDFYLLDQELQGYGCEIRSIKDRGGKTPEDALTTQVINAIAEFERRKIQERTLQGKKRKVLEGHVLRNWKSPYGFRYESGRLEVDTEEAQVVNLIYRLASEGNGTTRIQRRLQELKVPSPMRKEIWNCPTIRDILAHDLYRPHTVREIEGRVRPEVLSELDRGKMYGLWLYGRNSTRRETTFAETESGRQYSSKTIKIPSSPELIIAVPVPAFLDRGMVDRARAIVESNSGRKFRSSTRHYPLHGFMRCSCGTLLNTKMVSRKRKNDTSVHYHYYYCPYKIDNYLGERCSQKMLPAEKVEGSVSNFVEEFLKKPECLEEGLNAYLDSEMSANREQLVDNSRHLNVELRKVSEQRRGFQELAVNSLMTTEELSLRLRQLEDRRLRLVAEVRKIEERLSRLDDLEDDRERVLGTLKTLASASLENLTPQKWRNLYALLRLQVQLEENRTLRLKGVLCSIAGGC